ncbi:MAG: HAMP domain-containing histidine kinase [Lachnospiraceae bacterium]|nr:HAMP domain-containing histidine kinase [Lachnospiraceae bacterium]
MKNKRRKKLHSYIMFLLAVCILLGFLLDNLKDFFIGFFAGWNEMSNIEDARIMYGNLGQMIGWIIIGTSLITIGVCCYKSLRRKVTEPIERLANNMNEVREGNLTIRTLVDGDFEIIDMQDAFNSMVEELENAKKIREMTEQKNQQLYAGIAHDLKTPMTMLLGYAKLLEQNNNVSDEDRNRYIRTIIEQTEHTNALLDSLLAYTKLENQSYQLKKKKQDIVECLRECVANYYPMLEEAEIQLELLLPEKEIICNFDNVEMKRVFTNLLANMVKHNPLKTACIIRLEEVCNEGDGEKKICIIVADNGPKIPCNLHSTIFDSFVVGDDSRNTKNGSGLGLSISKKIIERHSGKLFYINDWHDDYKCFMVELCID